METLKVSAKSVPKAVAGAIAAVIRQGQDVQTVAIGASAVNQSVKSIVVARRYLTPEGIELVCVPDFDEIEINGSKKTTVKFTIESR